MARPFRWELVGLIPVTAQGDRQGHVFVNDGDHRNFFDQLNKECWQLSSAIPFLNKGFKRLQFAH